MGLLSHLIIRRVLVCMLFIGPAMLGYISYKQLPVELIPNAEFPLLVVQVGNLTEVTPDYMEREAILPLEGAIGTLGGIEELSSYSGSQTGIIYISYQAGTNIKYAQLKLEQKVNEVKETLEEGFQVRIQSINTSQLNARLMTLQVLGDGGVDRIRNVTDKDIIQKLNDIDGVADVQALGGREKTIEVILDQEACKAQDVTSQMIRNALNNMSASRSYAGNAIEGNQRLFVNVSGEFSNVNNLGNIIIKEKGPVLLKDVAEVNFGFKKETSYSRVDGKDVVTLNLVRDTQVNMIDISHRVIDRMEELNEELASKGVSLRVLDNQAETMEKNIDQIISLASFGGLLAIFILWIFLKRIRLVIILALSIPASIFISFNLFYAAEITINSLTLVGMALAVGMLLDNSIVVIENIYRLKGLGYPAKEAVVKGTREVSRSVIAATLTTITVFLPFVFADNYFVKLLGTHVGVSIVSTLVVSLLVALVLIPMLTYQAIKGKRQEGGALFSALSLRHRVGRMYMVMLKLCLRNPLTTVVGSVVFFLFSILLSLLISVVATPETDENEIKMYVSMPTGSTLELTDDVVNQLEAKLENIEEKDFVTSQIEIDRAVLTISLKE
ncbi:MAG: efflux RND transporter permease subunit, partial [Bacteroidota bacterium]